MTLSFTSVLYTALVIFLIYKTVLVLNWYIRTIQTSWKVPGFPDTRLIQGDLRVESQEIYFEKTLKFVQTTGVKMHKIWVYFFYPVYCLDHPDTAKVVLKDFVPKDDRKGSVYTVLKPWIGDGLLTNIGDGKLQHNRFLLTPAFNFDIMKEYVKKFNIVAEDLLTRSSLRVGGTGVVKILHPKTGEMDQDEQRHKDFLEIILMARDETGRGLTDTKISEEVDTFLFAGHDTSSAAMSWGVYALAKYPDIQEQVHQEVMKVAGTGQVELDHLSKLEYMLCFIKEVMRMYSIVPLIRRRLEEPLTIDDVTLPPKSTVEINIHAMNHNPSVWPDYEEFRPNRFSESSPNRDEFLYIPFSAGTRNCIGQNFAINELKVILSRLVQTFRIELDTSHEVRPVPQLVMTPNHGIKVYLHSR